MFRYSCPQVLRGQKSRPNQVHGLGGGLVAHGRQELPHSGTAHTTADKTATPLYHLSRVRQVFAARAPVGRTTILALDGVTATVSSCALHGYNAERRVSYSVRTSALETPRQTWACTTRASRLIRLSCQCLQPRSRRDFLRVARCTCSPRQPTPSADPAAPYAAATLRPSPTPSPAAVSRRPYRSRRGCRPCGL